MRSLRAFPVGRRLRVEKNRILCNELPLLTAVTTLCFIAPFILITKVQKKCFDKRFLPKNISFSHTLFMSIFLFYVLHSIKERISDLVIYVIDC